MENASELAERYTGPRWPYMLAGALAAVAFGTVIEAIEAIAEGGDFTLGDYIKLLAWGGAGATAGLFGRWLLKTGNLDGRRSGLQKIL